MRRLHSGWKFSTHTLATMHGMNVSKKIATRNLIMVVMLKVELLQTKVSIMMMGKSQARDLYLFTLICIKKKTFLKEMVLQEDSCC